MFVLSANLRRLVYVALFESLAIIFSTYLLKAFAHGETSGNFAVAVAISVIAVIWNFLFNGFFEWGERKLGLRGRSLVVRMVHSIGFEGGLVAFTVPLLMVWYRISFMAALQMEAAILIFFLVFTFVFTWVFDQIFALPNALRA